MTIKRILIVDDSATERLHLTHILTRAGYEVLTAVDGESGVATARAELPDLILMDVVMPGQNGYQATRILHHDPQTAAIPIVMCTSKGQETDKIWGMRQGAVDYLVKPVKADDLLAHIKALG